MTRYRTKAEIRMTWCCHRLEWPIVIPAHTRCRKITEGGTAGRFWVDDLRWVNRETHGFMLHDAEHYGIDIDPELVEAVPGTEPAPPPVVTVPRYTRRERALLDALEDAQKIIEGLLTDSQLDFRQPDGRTARERVSFYRETIAAAKAEG